MMDFPSEVGVGVHHAVGFQNEILIKHNIELSTSVVSTAKELRNTVIAVAVCWVIVSIIKRSYQSNSS